MVSRLKLVQVPKEVRDYRCLTLNAIGSPGSGDFIEMDDDMDGMDQGHPDMEGMDGYGEES
jgi:hypothetical protein